MPVDIALSLFSRSDIPPVQYPCALLQVRHALLWPTSLADFVSWLFRLLHKVQAVPAPMLPSPAAQHLVSWAVGLFLRFGFISP